MDDKIQDAIDNLGETEHSDALIAKANYLAKIGEKVLFCIDSRIKPLQHLKLQLKKQHQLVFLSICISL
jgi:hypothetical protein